MKLPEGKERQVIQDSIDAWRKTSKKHKQLIEMALYNAIAKYLPDGSSAVGWLATMAPTFVAELQRMRSSSPSLSWKSSCVPT
jgi:hypothetical protein